jgi:hypothetical protein
MANQPTNPMQQGEQSRSQQYGSQPVLSDTGRQPVVTPPPLSPREPAALSDFDEEAFALEKETALETGHKTPAVPVPESEAQPLPRPSQPRQKVRGLDRSATELSRGSRNAPPGDVIDIPAFLRKGR